MLFQELGITLPKYPMIWSDNIGVIALALNPVFHARTKHIEADCHFVREKVVSKNVQVCHMSWNIKLQTYSQRDIQPYGSSF